MSDEFIEMTDPASYMRDYEGPDFPERLYINSLLKDGESILDVGCGNGMAYESFKKYGKKVKYKGVDLSPAFIDFCKGAFPEVGWEIQDACHLNELDNSWDTVYLRNMLENCEYYDKPIYEALRVAKHRVIATFWNIKPSDRVRKIGSVTWGNFYSLDKLNQFMRSFGTATMGAYLKIIDNEIPGRRRFVYVIDKGN